MERSSGIILPIYSLPSPYGIGTLGKAAREFIDFLSDAKQTWWQVLPVGPTSFGDSPYQSPSAFAGNPYFIDLDTLIDEGLLLADEVDSVSWGSDPRLVDYAALFRSRRSVLKRAYMRAGGLNSERLWAFRNKNAAWLDEYALYAAIKHHFCMASWLEWHDVEARLHKPERMTYYRELLAETIGFECFCQMLFFDQWDAMRAYARERGVQLIGDLPIYVALDSCDVWAHPEQFLLDEQNLPREVAGVPPDSFAPDGQLWGNPLYNYEAMQNDGFNWWIRRIGGAARLYDMIRIDHFRGFESYWAVPAHARNAQDGRWVKGPGMRLVGTLTSWFSELSFIAEDLGFSTPEVAALLRESGLPGMNVLQFAFDSRDSDGCLPHSFDMHSVCYTGTHDNAPIVAWQTEADPSDVELARQYFGINDQEGFAWGCIRGGMTSPSNLFVAQMQDYLELGSDARTNTPGTLGQNWRWRLEEGQLSPELASRIATMTRLYGRSR